MSEPHSHEPMPKLPLPLVRLIHENLSTIMMFAYSRRPLEALLDKQFNGEWKYLRKIVFDVSEERANRACVELAVMMRTLDDQERLSEYFGQENWGDSLGQVAVQGSAKPMTLRDVCNKIIHAADLGWNFSDADRPRLVCFPRDRQRWELAEIEISGIAAVCGGLIH